MPGTGRESNEMFVNEDEAYWSTELGVLLIALHSACRRLGVAPRPPVPIARWARKPRGERATRWPVGDGPVFGGVDDGGVEDSGGARRASGDAALLRVKVLALLYANPFTPCTMTQVARAYGLRDGVVRRCRPKTALRVGRAWMAPFGHWKAMLVREGLVPEWPAELEPAAAAVAPPQTTGRRRGRRQGVPLRPLGGPRGA